MRHQASINQQRVVCSIKIELQSEYGSGIGIILIVYAQWYSPVCNKGLSYFGKNGTVLKDMDLSIIRKIWLKISSIALWLFSKYKKSNLVLKQLYLYIFMSHTCSLFNCIKTVEKALWILFLIQAYRIRILSTHTVRRQVVLGIKEYLSKFSGSPLTNID